MSNAQIESTAGVKMPGIIYGTAWKKEKTSELVSLALKKGFRGLDTACQPKHYNEAGVGEAVKKALKTGVSRSDLFIQTKFTPVDGHDPARIPYDASAAFRDQVAQSFSVSQENLHSEVIDSYVLHSPLDTVEGLFEVWGAMEDLYHSKKVRQLGVSNFYDPEAFKVFYEKVEVKPAILQNRFFVQTAYDFELRQFCKENSVVYQSFWTLTANPHLLESPVIDEISRKKERTPPQVLFSYLSSIGVLPLTGTQSEKHMEEDLQIFDFSLTDEEKKNINALGPFE